MSGSDPPPPHDPEPLPDDRPTLVHLPRLDASSLDDGPTHSGGLAAAVAFTDGRYAVRSELGRGGMGVVYLASDASLGRDVALKVLSRSGDASLLERFEREARITAQLGHPAIVPVHDLGRTAHGDLYYTMPRISGATLSELVRERRAACWGRVPEVPGGLSFFRLLQVFATVCRAVEYAHGRGVIHRDLKPGNVMLGEFGEVFVLDWGLAKALTHPDGCDAPGTDLALTPAPGTRIGQLLGTPAFMAPEQACEPGEVGPPADVYALGGILFVLLTGELPRTGRGTGVLLALAQGKPPRRAQDVRPSVPGALDELCRRAMAPAPGDRPSAAQLADAVEAFLEGRSLDGGRPDEAEFLRTYKPADFRRPSVTVDVALLRTRADGAREVLLQRRPRPPFAGAWALPGTFVQMEEGLEQAARRLLREECGVVHAAALRQLGAWGDPTRDPRTRVITIAYAVELAADDAPPAPVEGFPQQWFPLDPGAQDAAAALGVELAFDHAALLRAATAR